MTILHLVRTSAYQTNDLAQCLQVYTLEDTIVLLDDGCYNLQHHLINTQTNLKIVVIKEHCLARAVEISLNNQVISLDKLPTLFFSHNSILTWQ